MFFKDKLSEEQRKHFDNILVQARQELSSTRVEVTRVKTEHGAVLRKLEEDNGKLKRVCHCIIFYSLIDGFDLLNCFYFHFHCMITY